MSIDKVQLQQQEVVDNSVVNTDINPVTSTNSVIDTSTGSNMAETLDRVWNAVNSMLTRYVNSVNNRTGVVVLDANDVGLGNVDNVSFNDIKEWVIDYVKRQFKNRCLHIYGTRQEMLNDYNKGDMSFAYSAFWIDSIEPEIDFRSAIGYFYEDSGVLSYDIHYVNVVGYADDSIIYNENLGTGKNYFGAKIGVNIHPDEEALYVEHTDNDKYNSGLRIDTSKLRGDTYKIECLYGTYDSAHPNTSPSDGLLSSNASDNGASITIYIDDVEITSPNGIYLNTRFDKTIKTGDTIITGFGPYYTIAGGTYAVNPRGTSTIDLMNKQPAIGTVSSAPSDRHPSTPYVIKFYTMKTFADGFGLKYYDNHIDTNAPDSQLGLQFAELSSSSPASHGHTGGNISGLNATSGDVLITDSTKGAHPSVRINTPWALDFAKDGQYIKTDGSLEIYPTHLLAPSGDVYVDDASVAAGQTHDTRYYGSEIASNWAPFTSWPDSPNDSPYNADKVQPTDFMGPANGYATNWSALSVSLRKELKDSNYVLTTSQPANWENRFTFYYTRIDGIDGNPTYQKLTQQPDHPFVENRYYSYSDETGLYTVLTTKPIDWDDNYTNYYHQDSGGNYQQNTLSDPPIWTANTYFEKSGPTRYAYRNISGLALNNRKELTTGDSTVIVDRGLVQDELEYLGIYDGKDAVGKDIDNAPYKYITDGLSVNVGKFLEICPKTTGKAEKYNESGKVQVRIGDGLTEDITYTVIEDLEHISPPLDWYTHPERYAIKFEPLPGAIQYEDIPHDYYQITTEPDNWSEYYYAYYVKQGTKFFHIPKSDNPPEFVEDLYYRYEQLSWETAVRLVIGGSSQFKAICNVTRTNRIKVNLDNETIFFNRFGQLTAPPTLVEDFMPSYDYSAHKFIYDGSRVYYTKNAFTSNTTPADSVEDLMPMNNDLKTVKSIPIRFFNENAWMNRLPNPSYEPNIETTDTSPFKSSILDDNVAPTDRWAIVAGKGIWFDTSTFDHIGEFDINGNVITPIIEMGINHDSTLKRITTDPNETGYNMIGVNYGTSLTVTSSGLEAKLDTTTLTKKTNGAIAVKYGASMMETNLGLDVKIDGVTITKNSSGALVAHGGSSSVQIDASTIKRNASNALYVDIDGKSLMLIDQGGGRAAIGVNTDGTTIGLNSNNELCVIGGGGGGGSVAVDGTSIVNGSNGLQVNLDQQTLAVMSNTDKVGVNIDGRTLQWYNDTSGHSLHALSQARPFSSGTQDMSIFSTPFIPVYTLFIDLSTNKLYYATTDFTPSGNYATDFANLQQIVT